MLQCRNRFKFQIDAFLLDSFSVPVLMTGAKVESPVVRNPVIMDIVFSFLPTKDIKTVALVSPTWRKMTRHSKYWAACHVQISREEFEDMFESERVRSVGSLTLLSDLTEEQQERLLARREDFPSLHDVTVKCPMSADLLSVLSVTVRRLKIGFTLSPAHAEAVCQAVSEVAEASLHLRCLSHFTWAELSRAGGGCVSADTLAQVVVRVQEVAMSSRTLNSDQARAIFLAIRDCKTLRLRTLNLYEERLSSVPPEVLAEAVTRLEVAILPSTRLTSPQVKAVFRAIATSNNLRLQTLNLGTERLSSVPPDQLAEAVTRLKVAKLQDTHLTPAQVSSLFINIATCEELRLKTLWLSYDNPTSLSPLLLSEAVVRLEEAVILGEELCPSLVNAVCKEIVNCKAELRLKVLHFSPTVLKWVPCGLLNKVRKKVRVL